MEGSFAVRLGRYSTSFRGLINTEDLRDPLNELPASHLAPRFPSLTIQVARSPRRGSKGKHRLPRPRYLLKLSGYLGSCEHGCSEMESSFVETTPALCAIIHPPPPKCVSRRGRNTREANDLNSCEVRREVEMLPMVPSENPPPIL
jgi:hypothetical protein